MNQRQLENFIQQTTWADIVWATDLDGTLFDFNDNPQDVRAAPDLVQHIQKINHLTNGRFYVVTGRDMTFVDQALHPFKANISAEHHCLLRIDGTEKRLVDQPNWGRIDEKFNAATRYEGVWVETGKTFSRTIHYRNVTENQQATEKKLSAIADEIVGHYNNVVGKPQLGIKFGAKAIEIGPHAQDKGEAIDIIMSRPENIGKTPIYWGDSDADSPAGMRAQALGGIYIGVGPHPGLKDIADIHFETPEDARAALSKICNLSEKAPSPVRTMAPS